MTRGTPLRGQVGKVTRDACAAREGARWQVGTLARGISLRGVARKWIGATRLAFSLKYF